MKTLLCQPSLFISFLSRLLVLAAVHGFSSFPDSQTGLSFAKSLILIRMGIWPTGHSLCIAKTSVLKMSRVMPSASSISWMSKWIFARLSDLDDVQTLYSDWANGGWNVQGGLTYLSRPFFDLCSNEAWWTIVQKDQCFLPTGRQQTLCPSNND